MNIVEPITRVALASPESPAVISGSRTLSYIALMRDVAAVSSRLAESGVQHGDIVAVSAGGLAAHVLLTLAVARIGAASVPFHQMGAPAMRSFAEACGVRSIIHDDADVAAVDASGIANRLSLKELTSRPPRAVVPMARCEPGELFRIAFSSGTTGRQKPVKFSHGSMALRSHLMRAVFPAAPGERTMVGMGVGLHFSLGYILRSLLTGGAAVDRGGSVAAMAEAIRAHEVSMLITSPGAAVQLVQFAQTNVAYAAPPPTLRALCIGGARVAPALQSALRQHLCPNLYINYGMTEVGGMVAQADTALLQSHPTAAGRLMPWIEMQALDEEGNLLPFGSEGHLRVRSPTLADGYIGVDPQGTDAFRDGWFYSSDVGMVTGDGLVFLGGRSDVLNVGGTKVSPESLEAVIGQDPAILECAALTLPGELQQQLVVMVVAPRGFDVDAVRQRCAAGFGPALIPKAIIAVQELPHNAGGKLQRKELPALVARHLAGARGPGAARAS
jgi:acyl-coenzyme A synthetase/AMP-(fatty) acid ligase